MKKTIHIKQYAFGTGMVKVCVPIVAHTYAAFEQQVALLKELPCEVVEIRLDYFEDFSKTFLLNCFSLLNTQLQDKVILATFRSKEEGGCISLKEDEYVSLYELLMQHHVCDMIDVEYSKSEESVQRLLKMGRNAQILTVLSHHDFSKTPKETEMKQLLLNMAAFGSDFVKLAVMPQEDADVMRLMEVTKWADGVISQPLITMAMGERGIRSRIEGESFASCMTFAAGSEASAPGQLPCLLLKNYLQEFHKKFQHE